MHLHMLVFDGVYTFDSGSARFHEAQPPTDEGLNALLNRIVQRVHRRLIADGWLVQDEEQPWLDLEETDALDGLRAASIRYRIAMGAGAGQRTMRVMDSAQERSAVTHKHLTQDQQGFSLNASVCCAARQRDRLERLCRYITRPTIALERLSLNTRGEVLLELKRPFRDGTTHLRFTQQDFLARLAALVPRPRCNLTRYHGVLAPAFPWRRLVAPGAGDESEEGRDRGRAVCSRGRDTDRAGHIDAAREQGGPQNTVGVDGEWKEKQWPMPQAPLTWAQRLRRVFGIDIEKCPHCGGRLRVIGDVTDPELIERILTHVHREGLPRAPP